MAVTLGQLYNVGEKLTILCCTLILITMQRHQSRPNTTTVVHSYEDSTNVDATAVVPDTSKHYTIRSAIGTRAVRLGYVESAGRYADALTKSVGLEPRNSC